MSLCIISDDDIHRKQKIAFLSLINLVGSHLALIRIQMTRSSDGKLKNFTLQTICISSIVNAQYIIQKHISEQRQSQPTGCRAQSDLYRGVDYYTRQCTDYYTHQYTVHRLLYQAVHRLYAALHGLYSVLWTGLDYMQRTVHWSMCFVHSYCRSRSGPAITGLSSDDEGKTELCPADNRTNNNGGSEPAKDNVGNEKVR